MKYWEFLIQKEGDDTWLPLEAQQVEILEGRYRVVGHTDRLNASLEIWVSQLVTSEMPPRKRVRRRSAQTNEAGLVVLMPYMYLKPGQWEIKCSSPGNGLSNSSSNVSSNGLNSTDADWRYQVQLQVFSQTEEDGLSTQQSLSVAATAVKTSAIATESTLLAQTQAKLQDNLQRLGQFDDITMAAVDLPYRVLLQQEAFLARRAQAMTIAGQVQSVLPSVPTQEAIPGDSQLWLRLQDPQTAAVIMEAHRPLSLDRLPADFKVKIQLPPNLKTRIVLGEVSVRLADSTEPEKPAQILSVAAFTITAGIDQLLDEIASTDTGDFEEVVAKGDRQSLASPLLNPTLTVPAPAVGVALPHQPPLIVTEGAINGPLTAPSPTAPSSTAPSPTTAPSPSVPPPLVSQPVPTEPKEARAPKLPLAASSFLELPPMVAQPAQFMSTSIEDDDLETSQIAALLEDIDGDLASPSGDMSALEPPGIEAALPSTMSSDSPSAASSVRAHADDSWDADIEPDWDRETAFPYQDAQALAEEAESSRSLQQTKANLAFQSLKLKDHFWQRLSSLTHDSHEEARQLAEGMKAAGVSRTSPSPGNELGENNNPENNPAISPDESASLPPFQASWPENKPANSEVVIYEPVPLPKGRPPTTPPPTAPPESPFASSFKMTPPPQNADLPEVELPVISVPAGDLIAGGSVTITVRIRPSVYKPFIKLWMVDRQSRTLVGEPQLLTSLRPDTLGYLESSIELRVPMGCLDVQIAAIAVDMATQQESHKAIVNRHVVPANQSPTSLRNFNI